VKSLAEFIVRLANLAEAEGRLLRRRLVDLVGIVLAYHVAAILALAAVLMLVGAVFWALWKVMPGPAALALTAFCLLIVALLCYIVGRMKLKETRYRS